MRKIAALSLAAVLLAPYALAADPDLETVKYDALPPFLRYVYSSPNRPEAVILSMTGAGGSLNDLKANVDGAGYSADALWRPLRLSSPDAKGVSELEIPGYRGVSGSFSVSKSHTVGTDGGDKAVSDGSTASVRVRRGSDLSVASSWISSGGAPVGYLAADAGKDAAFLKFSSPLPDPATFAAADRLPKYSLNVSGTDCPIVFGNDPLPAGKCGYRNGAAFFPVSLLKDGDGAATLKIDGVPANYALFVRRPVWAGNVLDVRVSASGADLNLRAAFEKKGSDFPAGKEAEFRLDGSSSDKVSVGLDGVAASVSLGALPVAKKALSVQVRDAKSQAVSDPVFLDISQKTAWKVSSVETKVSGVRATLVFRSDSPWFFQGAPGDYLVTLNGKEYSLFGKRVDRKEADGSVAKDINGYVRFDMVGVTPIRHGTDTMEIDLASAEILEKNEVSIKNSRWNRETPKVSFAKDGGSATEVSPAAAPAPEKLSAVPAAAVSDSGALKDDFAPKAYPLASLKLENLVPEAAYEFSFELVSDSAENAFSAVKYGDEFLLPSLGAGGKMTYSYSKKALGSGIRSADISWAPSGLKSSPGAVRLSVSAVVLKKLSGASFVPVAALAAGPSASVRWIYDFANCWDGGRGGCAAAGLKSASAAFAQTFSGNAQVSVSQAVPAAVSAVSAIPAAVVTKPAVSVPAAVIPAANSTPEPALSRTQRAAALALGKDIFSRLVRQKGATKGNALSSALVAEIRRRLPGVPDGARRAYLRAVAAALAPQ